jgi:hypothetical protein
MVAPLGRFAARDVHAKAVAIERGFFDADRGCTLAALERITDVRVEFPDDAAAAYSEGILRKDFLGQGLRASELFQLAQQCDPRVSPPSSTA